MASVADLLAVVELAQQDSMYFSTPVFDCLGGAVAQRVCDVLDGGAGSRGGPTDGDGQGAIGLAEVRQLQGDLQQTLESLLFLGASPSKAIFEARLRLLVAAAACGENVHALEGECLAEEMMIAGHEPDAVIVCLMLRLVGSASARGEAGIADVARIMERAIGARIVADEDVLLEMLAATEAAAMVGGVSLADALQLLERACVLSGADSKRPRVLGRLLRVCGAAAPHGLASVDEAVELVERLLQILREAGKPARLEAAERDALVEVLAGAARAGSATAEDADAVMRHLDVAGERPSVRMLTTLLDVVLVEASRGQVSSCLPPGCVRACFSHECAVSIDTDIYAFIDPPLHLSGESADANTRARTHTHTHVPIQATPKDAAHIINRIKGCGFECSAVEWSKVLFFVGS